ncbi:PREDICTED: uncharacterized protein LOC105367968 [Ceratosolen solmsi marchali]|uniref:Uncharacterized protein LOC105367968 n=1 Tax=Ceratosolen solmsi marchali TaxID=326594 RepID=A0AAJ6YVJ9_9HYME|nr:PREDICTED: uncharacterized protein LOC105367968 [Ceratosolen solmsi marchali]
MSISILKSIFIFCMIVDILQSRICGHVIQKVQAMSIEKVERPIFNYHRNGVRIDMRIVPSTNQTSPLLSIDDGFPQFPLREVGRCLLNLSLTCVNNRVVRFLNIIGHLHEITLFGQTVKLVKLKELSTERLDERRMLDDSSNSIDRSIDDFFETFALRITLPKWKGAKNQIDVMMDDKDAIEGRGGKGGGGKGGGKGGKGGKGGGCKKMMMMMFMGLKMKMMGMFGMAAMKGMLMSGMSLMLSKMMLLHQLMSKKGGLFGGFGGGSSNGIGNQGPLKEIVLLTKAGGNGGSGGGGCNGGGCGGLPPSDSYGAPPASGGGGSGGYDYSGGGGSGGAGWGRSFNQWPISYIYREQDHKPAIVVPEIATKVVTQMTSDFDNKWDQMSTGNNTLESISKQLKSSHDTNKNITTTKSTEGFINGNYLQTGYV